MLARFGLFVLWCFVLWGTLWDAALLWTLVSEGLGAAASAALEPPTAAGAAAWGNRACGLLAVLAWAFVLLGRWSWPRTSP
jgi:hypothetical protein